MFKLNNPAKYSFNKFHNFTHNKHWYRNFKKWTKGSQLLNPRVALFNTASQRISFGNWDKLANKLEITEKKKCFIFGLFLKIYRFLILFFSYNLSSVFKFLSNLSNLFVVEVHCWSSEAWNSIYLMGVEGFCLCWLTDPSDRYGSGQSGCFLQKIQKHLNQINLKAYKIWIGSGSDMIRIQIITGSSWIRIDALDPWGNTSFCFD